MRLARDTPRWGGKRQLRHRRPRAADALAVNERRADSAAESERRIWSAQGDGSADRPASPGTKARRATARRDKPRVTGLSRPRIPYGHCGGGTCICHALRRAFSRARHADGVDGQTARTGTPGPWQTRRPVFSAPMRAQAMAGSRRWSGPATISKSTCLPSPACQRGLPRSDRSRLARYCIADHSAGAKVRCGGRTASGPRCPDLTRPRSRHSSAGR